MKKNILLLTSILTITFSCKKNPTPTTDPCTGKTITISATATNTSGCSSDGTISASASGSTGFTYSINGVNFQQSGTFTGLAAKDYTVTAKDAQGCTATKAVTVSATVKNITVTASATNTSGCTSDGSIAASATGSTGFTYSINGTTFQGSGSFTGLAAGSYTVTAKDAQGCTATKSVTVANAPAGPLFTAVKNVIQTNCIACHSTNGGNSGGKNFETDCNIVSSAARIKARTVDGSPSFMPLGGQLNAGDKKKINDWFTAGGKLSN